MASLKPAVSRTVLARIEDIATHEFKEPVKKINDGDELQFFHVSKAYTSLTLWLMQLNRSMFPSTDENGDVSNAQLDNPPAYSQQVKNVQQVLAILLESIKQAPPESGPRRFGNTAFRRWYQLADECIDESLSRCLGSALVHQDETGSHTTAAIKEVRSYLMGSFGSQQRLDYGTGHELSFLAFLGCLWELGVLRKGEERAIVIGIIEPYLHLVRNLILTYNLEPAGSHGVWGLDDHSFLPYIFGSAQLGPPIPAAQKTNPPPTEGSISSAPDPALAANKAEVARLKTSNMYFSAVQFINDVKKGPFWEHSPILYDVSGIKTGWAKINKGMLKMYAAEVLGKFPVVQHFPFGSIFRWERDEAAIAPQADVHSRQQPSLPANGGTAAPWAQNAGHSSRAPQGISSVSTSRPVGTSRPPALQSTFAHSARPVARPPARSQRQWE